MPAIKSILALSLFAGLGAFAAGCDKAHEYQPCQVAVKAKIGATETTIGYTQGVCFPVVIDDEGETQNGEPEVVVSKFLHVVFATQSRSWHGILRTFKPRVAILTIRIWISLAD